MAEKLMEHALAAEEEPLRSLKVASAGIAASNGETASANSHKALQKVGLSLDGHRSQPVSHELIDRSLVVFGMTESHRALLTYHFDALPQHVYLMREFLNENHEIPDPYGMALGEYEACRDSMVEAIPAIVRFLKQITTK